MTSQERLTIIPHGVPYMTQLLRYFVTEDSIFLHLEHVKGEWALGAPSAPQAFGRLSCLIPLKFGARYPATGPAFLEGEGRTSLLWASQ